MTFRDIPWTIEEMATLARVGTTRISEAKQICAFQLEDMVLAREIAFGEAFKMASLVRAAGLSKRVHDGALTLDQAYKKSAGGSGVCRRRSRTRYRRYGKCSRFKPTRYSA